MALGAAVPGVSALCVTALGVSVLCVSALGVAALGRVMLGVGPDVYVCSVAALGASARGAVRWTVLRLAALGVVALRAVGSVW